MKKILVTIMCVIMVVAMMPAVAMAEGQSVAKIGDKEFDSLEAAVKAAEDGTTIELLADVVVDKTITVDVGGRLYIDLAGNTISTSKEGVNAFHVTKNVWGLYLAGGVFDAKIFVEETGVLYFETGVMTNDNLVYKDGLYPRYVDAGYDYEFEFKYNRVDILNQAGAIYYGANYKCGNAYFLGFGGAEEIKTFATSLGVAGEPEICSYMINLNVVTPDGKVDFDKSRTVAVMPSETVNEGLARENAYIAEYEAAWSDWAKVPAYDGYVLSGWYKAETENDEFGKYLTEFDMNSKLTGDVEVWTKWEKAPLKVEANNDAQNVADKTGEKIINNLKEDKTPDNIVEEDVLNIIKDAIASGTTADLDVETIVEANVQTEDTTKAYAPGSVEKIEQIVGDKGEIVEYLDVKVSLKVDNGQASAQGKISEIEEPITFTIDVPENLQGKELNFYVVRVHDGKAEKLQTKVSEDGKTLSFETDKFSTYALVSEAVKEVPKTSDTNTMMPWIVLMAVSAACAVVFKKKEN